MKMLIVVAVLFSAPAAQVLGQGSTAATSDSNEGDVLQLTGFGAGLASSLLTSLWDAEGIYLANHSARVKQWRHENKNLLLTYEPLTAGPLDQRRWVIFDVGQNDDLLTGDRPLAELPDAGPRPWTQLGSGWLARDCLGVLRETAAELVAPLSRRQVDACSTLTWRLTGLGEQHPSLAPLAGRFSATEEFSSGAPVYRADSGAVLQRVVSGTRSSWVLHSQRDSETQIAALGEFADRINLIQTERFVASGLPGQGFLEQPRFICTPDEWESGDTDFTLPDLDGYEATDDINAQGRWSRQQFSEEDSETYEQAFGSRPEEHARLMVVTDVIRTNMIMTMLTLTSPRIYLTGPGCMHFRLRNEGFHLAVSILRDDGRHEDLKETSSISGWRDVVVSLPGSGQVTLTVSDSHDPSDRFAASQVLAFNETCGQLLGRVSACRENVCQNGGTCVSVTIKHRQCLCPPGYLGARCETRVNCGEPSEIPFGRLTRRSGSSYLDRAYYACLPGYAPSKMVLGVSWSVCHHNGSWANVPRCEPQAARPYIDCNFTAECPGFNTRVDNEYNTDTDHEWARAERLQTSDIRPRGSFLTTYRGQSLRTITARLRTPCLDLQGPGCLQLDAYLSNASLTVTDGRGGPTLFRTEESGLRQLVPLRAQVGPLLLVARLEQGDSEAALDSVRVYRHTCDQVQELVDAAPLPWPTWPPPGRSGQSLDDTRARSETAASAGDTAPIVLAVVPLMALVGVVAALCHPRLPQT